MPKNSQLHVAYYTYLICKKFKLDYFSAARAAMLHDFFLYDWRTGTDHEGAHAFTHPETALSNAIEHFEINEKEVEFISLIIDNSDLNEDEKIQLFEKLHSKN